MANEPCIHCGQPSEDGDRVTESGRVHERCWDAFNEEKPVAKSSVVAGCFGLSMAAGGAVVLSIGLAAFAMGSSLGGSQNPLVGIPAAIMWFMAMAVAFSAIPAGGIMLSIAFFTWVVTKISGVGPKDSELPAHDQELAQEASLTWVVWYRKYLYFALVLSVVGQLLIATRWGGSFGMIFMKVVVVVFILMSLRRIGEKWITILHLAVNGATLMAALFLFLRVFGIYSFFQSGIIQLLVLPAWLLGADLSAPLRLADSVLGSQRFVSIFGALALGLISAYWLKKLYQLVSTSRWSSTV